jgi:hypothetical protein
MLSSRTYSDTSSVSRKNGILNHTVIRISELPGPSVFVSVSMACKCTGQALQNWKAALSRMRVG